MDLIRKMSGLRSSQELTGALGEANNGAVAEGAERGQDEVLEQEEGDVYLDAPGQQQPKQESAGSRVDSKKDGAGGSAPVRAPVSDEYDALDDDDDDDAGYDEEEEDGRGSYGSGESFDSALERMAGSSEAAYDTASSPKNSSPVGSFTGPAVLGNPPSVMSVSQQGALMRLNQMLTGDDSLDTSIIDNSTEEEFQQRITELAENQGRSPDDASFSSIVDALLPLVLEKTEKKQSDTKSEGTGDSVTSQGANHESSEAESPIPQTIVTTEGESEGESYGDNDEINDEMNEESQKQSAGDGVSGDGEAKSKLPKRTEESGEQAKGDKPEASASLNGGGQAGAAPENVEESAEVQAMPKAKLTADDEGAGGEEPQDIGEPTETVDSPEVPEDTQARPVAKLTDGEEQEKLPQSKSTSSEAQKEGSVATETPRGLSDEKPSHGKAEEENKPVPMNADEMEDADEAGDWDEDVEEDEDEDGAADRSSALAALVHAADSAAAGGVADPPSLGAAGPSLPARPTRSARSSAPSLEPSRHTQQPQSTAAAIPQIARSVDESQVNGEAADGNEETREKLQVIRVKFLRLALRLGQSAHNVVVAQVLYRLGLAEQLRGGRSGASRSGAFSFDRASAIAEEQEAAGPEELDFTCTIMLLGKTGVGKSATINSIFDEAKTGTNAFSPSTKKVQVITGHVHGIKVRVIDTPGLLPSVADQRHNEKVMASVKGFISKQSPDIVLYFDRLDMQSRDYGDLPLLRTITDTFGAAVWFNAIVVLTHASSAPPDGPNGLPLSYEMFVAQRSHVVQQTIRQAAGDMRLMNPVSLVENHSACRVNRSRQRVLPNGQVWKPQLLLLCFASKILAEANSLLKLQDSAPGRPFGARTRAPPLPFLLSSLLQSRAQLKMPDEQLGEEDESDEELDDDEDSDDEEDYDQLPPFRRLAKEEVAELDEDNRVNYFEELAERERLFQKKQWKEEKKRRRELKKRMAGAPMDQSQFVDEGLEDDMARSAAVPVPMPDMVLPPSFDSDNPSHRYRYLETANQWLVRPVLETHGWDHDNGYDGMSVEKMFVVRDQIPASVSGQITKDKKDANLNMECAASLKHGEGKVTLAGLDLQTVGKDVAYTLRSETRFSNFKGNKTTGGLALTLLGDTVSAGMKIEDRLIVGKRVKVVLNGGAITGRGDVAYGGSLEATLRDQDYPLSRTLSSLGLSIMDWHGDLAIGGNLQSQFVLGKTMMVGRANLNNRGAGQISIRASSSDQLQMALIGLLPIIRSLANRLFGSQPQQ